MKNSLSCAVLTLACVVHAASAAAWAPATFPNPYSDVSRCGRAGLPSRICDPDSVLTSESANVVEGMIKSIEAAKLPFAPSPCPAAAEGGYQVRARMLSVKHGLHDEPAAHHWRVGSIQSATEAADGYAKPTQLLRRGMRGP